MGSWRYIAYKKHSLRRLKCRPEASFTSRLINQRGTIHREITAMNLCGFQSRSAPGCVELIYFT